MTHREPHLGRLGLILLVLVLHRNNTAHGADQPTTQPQPPVLANIRLDDYLAREVWREYSCGVTLRPPLGTKLRHDNMDDAILTIIGEPGYTIRVSLKKSKSEMAIAGVLELATGQVAIARPQALIIDQADNLNIATHAGGYIYFGIPDKKGTWVLGQAFVLVNPQTLVMLNLEIPQGRFKEVRPIFEAVLASIRLEDPKVLVEQRKKMIAAGAQWSKILTTKNIQAAFAPEQWYRITQTYAENHQEITKDIGYLRIKCAPGKELDAAGLKVETQARLKLHDGTYDTLSQVFLSDDLSQEIWSIRTTFRPLKPTTPPAAPKPPAPALNMPSGGGEPGTISWVESGIRTGPLIRITRESPSGIEEHRWPTPEQGYLPQAALGALGQLLPRDQPGNFGFYAYYPNTGKLAYRTERVVPATDGTYTVLTRASLEQPEQTSKYDHHGKLLWREMGENRKLIPAGENEVKALWKFK